MLREDILGLVELVLPLRLTFLPEAVIVGDKIIFHGTLSASDLMLLLQKVFSTLAS